jgi:hypothetical protein
MFKHNAETRAAMAAKKRRQRASQSERSRRGERKANRDRHHKNKGRYNAGRRARANRKPKRKKAQIAEHFASLSIVDAKSLLTDQTAWQGPGSRRERALEQIATELILTGKISTKAWKALQKAENP